MKCELEGAIVLRLDIHEATVLRQKLLSAIQDSNTPDAQLVLVDMFNALASAMDPHHKRWDPKVRT